MYGPRPAARLCNEKMAFVWARTAMVPLGRVENWPFLYSACLNTGCETGAHVRGCECCCILSFVFAVSVVFADVSCFQLWEMLGQVKNIDFEVCKLLTQVVHVTLDTLLVKARSFVDNCTFWDRIRQRECRCALADRVASEPTRLGLCAWPTAQLQQLSTRPPLQCYMLLLAKKIETVTRKPNKGACMLEGSGACTTCA